MLRIFNVPLTKCQFTSCLTLATVRKADTISWRSRFGAIFIRRQEPVAGLTSSKVLTNFNKMSQAKISAFFRKKYEATPSAFETSSDTTEPDSPVKTKSKRKSRIVSSDRYVSHRSLWVIARTHSSREESCHERSFSRENQAVSIIFPVVPSLSLRRVLFRRNVRDWNSFRVSVKTMRRKRPRNQKNPRRTRLLRRTDLKKQAPIKKKRQAKA